MNTKRHRILRFKINLNFYSHFTAITVKRITDIVSFVFRCLFFSVFNLNLVLKERNNTPRNSNFFLKLQLSLLDLNDIQAKMDPSA